MRGRPAASAEARRFNEQVGRRIELTRRGLGLTARELARAAGISPSALCHYESGDRGCAAEIVARLAAALGVRVSALLLKFPN